MKKAKALQDFWYGIENISKGDVLEDMRPGYIVENNHHIFECPYEEELTSEEEDEAARQYIWVPKKGSNVFRINSSLIVVGQNWSGISYDWFYFRCGMIFMTKSEAVQAAKLMMQDCLRI